MTLQHHRYSHSYPCSIILTHWLLKNVAMNFKFIFVTYILSIFGEIPLRFNTATWPHWWLVNIGSVKMAWCHLATNHHLNQYWLRSMMPHGITGPQWVKHCNNYIICMKSAKLSSWLLGVMFRGGWSSVFSLTLTFRRWNDICLTLNSASLTYLCDVTLSMIFNQRGPSTRPITLVV